MDPINYKLSFCLLTHSLLFSLLPLLLHALSFNRTNFKDWPELIFDGDADVNSRGILTLTANVKGSTNIDSVGRAVFSKEMLLWDPSTQNSADFDTTFSFSMRVIKPPRLGDGFAFFLAHNGSHVPPNAWGGCLALISNCENSTTTGLVAVEFDTYKNDFETNSSHVGINVNSIRSVKSVVLSSWSSGSKGVARIWYSSLSKNLSVSLTYQNQIYNLSQQIDLSKVLPARVTVGFSASTGYATSTHKILSWEFNSTDLALKQQPDNRASEDGGKDLSLVFICVVGGSFLVFDLASLLIFAFCCWKRTRREVQENKDLIDASMDREFEHDTGPKRFSYNELVRATNKFAGGGKLGEGGFGGVYKGYLRDLNLNVAVKRVSKGSKQGRKEYISEVKIISRLRHRNLVQLIGWCHENGEFLLIYEFLPNGSLDSHLFGRKTKLSWAVRYKIALGLASGLLYLHEESEQCVLHRDIKSSNIMLDSNFNTKLGDFGLARLVDEAASHRTTGLAGTLGYMAPEYISTSKASKASDVYSFGVVLLEIACGRKSIEHNSEEDRVSLVSWVWESYGNEKLLDVVDERLCMEFDVKQMKSLLTVGLWCVHPDHNLRPSIKEVIQVLSFEAPLPDLPKKMPVPNYQIPVSEVPLPTSVPSITYSSLVVGR